MSKVDLEGKPVKCHWCDNDAYLIKPNLNPICKECFFEGIGKWVGDGKTLVAMSSKKRNEK